MIGRLLAEAVRAAPGPRPRRPGLALAATLALAIGLTSLVAATEAQPPTMAWLDAPLPGSVLPAGPISVIAHAAHPSGIVRVELFADGVLVDTLDTGNTISTFLVAPFEWLPPAPGSYNLAVRAFSAAAGWSDAAGAGITVDGNLVAPSERPTESASPDASRSPSPGRSGSPAPTASGRATPTPSAAPGATPSAGPTSALPTPTTGPGPTPTTGPGPTPPPTAAPTPPPTPTPPPCTPIAPDLVSPPDGTTIFDTTQPTLLWEYLEIPNCLPSSFRVQVSTSRDFSTLLYNEIVASTSWEWTPPSPLADCQTYAWRVFPRRSDGANGPSSAIWTFSLLVGRCA